MDSDIPWGVNAQPNFVAANLDDGQSDVVADRNAFALFPTKNQHG
jgi:hypothetical protein